ncbi:hypothetical protein PISMIDRAFT_683467 [Pisolithus microcarpus 441]|uniref:Uncharacterized protein n=1 Tax=Pisolithus microcarpus 441 TaxID=765257 RepID=A0A0C9Y346_9AGAM|nr:hypothetical protein PISMIDRAFT_683467 [Pisolithus microcarpus 441]
MRRGDYNQETSNSTKLFHIHGEPTFGSTERRRGNSDSTILQHFRPSDMETAVRALEVGGPVALLMDDDVPGVKWPEESRCWLHRSSSG